MPAGRPRKDKTPKLGPPPIRVDKRSEEYYLDRALQTPGLLTGADYMKALERLMQIRTNKTKTPEGTPEQKSERLARLLSKNADRQDDSSTI